MKDASKANYVNCINKTGNFATVEHHEAKWPTLLDVEPVIFQHSVCDPVSSLQYQPTIPPECKQRYEINKGLSSVFNLSEISGYYEDIPCKMEARLHRQPKQY